MPRAPAFSSNQGPVITIRQAVSPTSVAFDRSGNLWVDDRDNNRILEFSPPFSSNMSASAVIGQSNFNAHEAGLEANRLNSPAAIAFDLKGDLWIADYDNDRVLEFKPPFRTGMNASLVIGKPDFTHTLYPYIINWYPSANAAPNRFAFPMALAFDPSGDLWVSDTYYNRVVEFKPPFANGMSASIVIGQQNLMTGLCPIPANLGYPFCPLDDAGPATLRMNGSIGLIAFDESGDLWVADLGDQGGAARILEFKPPFTDGLNASLVLHVYSSGPHIPAITAILFDQAGNLWVGSTEYTVAGGRLFEFQPPFSDNMNATFVMGSDYSEAMCTAMMRPAGLAFDSAGNLWVADVQGVTYFCGGHRYGEEGRTLGFDAHTHTLATPYGQIHFRNSAGLIAPLSSAMTSPAGSILFPQGTFNFTIQGLAARGSVIVTITFPQLLPSGVRWWSQEEGVWRQLPANQTEVSGNNMTLTLTNASQQGVISVVGGPGVSPVASSSVSSITPTSSPQQKIGLPSGLIFVPLAIVIIAIALSLHRKLSKPRSDRRA
jgi:sugar lactone lactonase YvrE